MSDINKFTGTGRLGTEPRIITTEAGTKIGKLFALLNESYVDKAGTKHESTLPMNLTLFKPADIALAETNLHTGSPVAFSGKLAMREYEVAGEKRTSVDVVIAGPGSKLELAQAKAKAAEAIGPREVQANAPGHVQ